jgi:hypothetical protein
MTPSNTSTDTLRRIAWIALIAAASVGASLVFACATPFAALATLGAINLRRHHAFALAVIVWLVNQTIGYGVLGYPRTFDSFAWGGAIGAAALLATWAALAVGPRPMRTGPVFAAVIAFGAAFVCYELALYLTSFMLPSGDSAFSLRIVWYILEVNVIAFAGLIALCFGASAIGLAQPAPGTIAGGAR